MRLSLFWRLAAVVISVGVVLQIVAVAVVALQLWAVRVSPSEPPVLERVAALMTVADDLNAQQRQTLATAVTTARTRVTITQRPPTEDDAWRSMPVAEVVFPLFLRDFADRDLKVFALRNPDASGGVADEVRMIVALRDGAFLSIEEQPPTPLTVRGLPSFVWIGLVATFGAILTLLLVLRETQPLRQLTESLASAREPFPVMEPLTRGAVDVQRLSVAISAMQRRIRDLVADREFIMASIAHDIRTYASRLRMRVEDLPDDHDRNKASDEIAAMMAILDEMISLASTGPKLRPFEPLALFDIIEDLVEDARERKLPVTMSAAADDIVVSGDELAIRRIVTNVIENAVKYGRSAHVSLTATRNATTIFVDDEGAGVPVADRERVFKPFERLEPSRSRDTGGAGLGLAIARQLVEAHGGEIRATNTPDGRGRMEIVLPRMRPAESETRAAG